MNLFLTNTNKSILICDVTTQSRTANGTHKSKHFEGLDLSIWNKKPNRCVQAFFCYKKAKINVLPTSAKRSKKSFKNLYVKIHTKQNWLVKASLQYKCNFPTSVLHNLLELSSLFSCFGRITKNGHVTLPIKG